MAKTDMSWQSRIASTVTRTFGAGTSGPIEPDGGLALARNKPGHKDIGVALDELSVPEQLVFPLLDYAKRSIKPLVRVGSIVKTGDMLAEGVLATASGTVSAIESRPFIHPSYREALSVILDINADSNDDTQTMSSISTLTIDRVERACIAGLGGAGFSTASKLQAVNNSDHGIQTLLVNAVECEPLISCDEALIRSDAKSVVRAVHSMTKLSACRRCVIAIEDDKHEAIAALNDAIDTSMEHCDVPIELVQLSAIYPSGAEKVLVQRITGKHMTSGSRASDLGVLCLNVATIVAAWHAQNGHPMISRIVTIGGSKAAQPGNVRVRIGTSVAQVLELTGNWPIDGNTRIRAGGPLSGFDLQNLSVPVTATTNCIGIEAVHVKPDAVACIRCSHCSDVCPVNLLPQQLYWHANANDVEGAMRFGLDSCIECGCCDMVCPSSIELTSTFRYARAAWRDQLQQKQDAELAKARYEQREIRLAIREQEAQRLRERKKSQLGSSGDPIADALARARARKRQR